MPMRVTAANNQSSVLDIHKLVVAAPFDSQTFIYRTGEFTYERDHYAEFLVPPAEDLMTPLRDYFTEFGTFRFITIPGSVLKPNTVVEIRVDELYGDFRNRNQPAAVLTMGFTFFDAPSGVPGKLLLQKHYQQRIRLQARTAAGVVAGWNKALQQILLAVNKDLQNNAPQSGASRQQARR